LYVWEENRMTDYIDYEKQFRKGYKENNDLKKEIVNLRESLDVATRRKQILEENLHTLMSQLNFIHNISSQDLIRNPKTQPYEYKWDKS